MNCQAIGGDLLFWQLNPHIWQSILALEPFLAEGSFAHPSLCAFSRRPSIYGGELDVSGEVGRSDELMDLRLT
jgi:hypothetical protein